MFDVYTPVSFLFNAACAFAVLQAWQMPLQQNDVDCGIFVCQYIHALVEACFEGAENGVRFSMSPLAYRRGLREDVCALAEGRLIGELTAAGHEIPPGNEIRKPHEAEVIGDEVEDKEWRAEMAERMHRLEVRNEGQAVAIAKLERRLRVLMLSRAPQHGVDGEAAGEGHGNEAGDGGTGEPAAVEVKGGVNAGTHDIMGGAHGEGLVAAVETGEGVKDSILEAATAYAAAAHICRPSLSGSKMVELSEEDRSQQPPLRDTPVQP
ncbi:unnamed protein product [Closterium sp. Naga37s-1]|nr:unnamed protein product [Closterium sp. Naga37s-1]